MKRKPQHYVLNATPLVSSARPADKYEYVFATNDYHGQVTSLAQLRKEGTWNTYMGLFCNGKSIGYGSLARVNWSRGYIHTEAVRLRKEHRRKGHGIALYAALIHLAKSLGAKRLYSSTSLNKYSGRMWRVKLKRYGFNVKTVSQSHCMYACKHCTKTARFYIDL
jgi:GNAT superfamily N-acetyltransferase